MKNIAKRLFILILCVSMNTPFLAIHTDSFCAAHIAYPFRENLTPPFLTPFKDHMLFAFNKHLFKEDLDMQKRGITSVERMRDAALGISSFEVHAMIEPASTLDDYEKNPFPPAVSQKIVFSKFRQFSPLLADTDTFIVYSHSHGVRNRFALNEPWGGLRLDFEITEMSHQGITIWPDYANEVLQIPGQTVVILVMACYSGGFIDYLETIRDQWEDRNQEKRNFLVITSQNNRLQSGPVSIRGEILNPFAYSVQQAFLGKADGCLDSQEDGKVTMEEFIQYITTTTQALSPKTFPQAIGSYDPGHVLFVVDEVDL